MARISKTGQRGKISKLYYSCVQSSRHWKGKSKNRELTKVNIKKTNENLEAKMFLVFAQKQALVDCES